ncbi:helix-turn-helix domain-containing protein [Streptomyces sp. DSM 44917]|uniref:Helix-turn-helix domain-containing protein n=1 Tax=Streptomyces boetiae TaxID=3075541 RepID=A0ABU2LD76_9ACTN|nr:helix-turn-helix domain-containing protein [Streptomyces sp. DSM 44917]MDT0309520.1 helix-turn-helix domain-containing protein [Streptomyces sp. DSM 44917]
MSPPPEPSAPSETPAPPEARDVPGRPRQTRELILDAAVACLMENGYAGASTLAIQARAGVSRGGLLHHFRSREELLVAAALHVADTESPRNQERVVRELAAVPEGRARSDRFVELLWESHHRRFFWAAMELWNAARTDPSLREALRPAERAVTASVLACVERTWGPAALGRPGARELRDVLMTSMRGAALTYAFRDHPPATDPRLPAWKDLADRMLHGD